MVRPGELAEKAYQDALEIVKQTRFTSSQFRNLFSELREIEASLLRGATWEEALIRLDLFMARLAYGTRKEGRVPHLVYKKLAPLVRRAQASEKAFRETLMYLEAVLAFFYPLRDLKERVERESRRDQGNVSFDMEAEQLFGKHLRGGPNAS